MRYSISDILEYDIKNPKMGICINKNGVFDNFQKPFINFFYAMIKNIFDKYEFCKSNKEVIMGMLINGFVVDLIDCSMRTLIYDFNEEYENIYEKEGDAEYKLKDKSFCDIENIRLLLLKYPLLKNMIELKINFRLKLIEDILDRINSDKDEIYKEFNIDINKLNNISLGEGDIHNNGKTVAILSFSDNRKIIYKPRTLDIDISFNKIINYINSKNNKIELYKIKSLDKNTYGWQEFIEYKECKTEKEIEYYFYSIGELLAIVHVLGSSDIHYENIISCGKNPVIIDLETLMTNRSNVDIEKEYIRYLVDSVLSTMMIPNKMITSSIDMDISGVGAVVEQKSENLNSFMLVNKFKNNISLESKITKLELKQNVAKLNGEVALPSRYLYKIEEGFKDISLLILNNKNEFLDVVLDNEYNIRQVIRATYIYGMYMSASEHPKYLKSDEAYNSVFDVLKFSKNEVFTEEIIDTEIKILKTRNIPYFYTKLYKRDLYYIDENGNEEKIENYYSESLDTVLREKVNKLSIDNIEQQLRIIRLSFVDELNDFYNSHNKVKYSNNMCEVIEDVINIIEKYSFGENEKYIVDLTLCNKLYIMLMNYSIYEGGSILLLLNYYAHFKKNNDLKVKADKLLNTIVSNYPYSDEEVLSAYSGIGSMIYIYYNLYKLWGEEKYKNKYEEALNIVSNGLDKYKYELDYLNGSSSLIILLSNIYIDNNNSIIKEIALRILNKLKDMYNADVVNKTGLAHGYSGIALSFFVGGKVFNEEKYLELGKSIILQEDSYYDENISNWKDIRTTEKNDLLYWCYGVGGITLARYMILKEFNSNIIEDDFNRGINKLREIDLSKIDNDSMCHGFFGVIDMLNIMNIYSAEDLKAMIEERIYKINDEGFKDGFKGNGDIFGGMIGISGMALTILRVLCNQYPSILSLDIYRGNVYE